MTENKRFDFEDEYITLDGGVFATAKDRQDAERIGRALNQLYGENEQLKQEYLKLKHRHSLLHDECLDVECERDSLKKDVGLLEEENEQLKKQLSHLEYRFTEYRIKLGDMND